MDYEQLISKAANRQLRKTTLTTPERNKDGFVTIHTRIHYAVHALLKEQAKENNLSIAAMLEFILIDKYKPMLATATEPQKAKSIAEIIKDFEDQ